MVRWRIRFPTTSTVDIIRKAKAGLPAVDRARQAEGDPAEELMALRDEEREKEDRP